MRAASTASAIATANIASFSSISSLVADFVPVCRACMLAAVGAPPSLPPPSVRQFAVFGTTPSNELIVACGMCGSSCRSPAPPSRMARAASTIRRRNCDDGDVARAERARACGRRSAPSTSHIAMSWLGMPRMPVKLPSFIACAVLPVQLSRVARRCAKSRVDVDARSARRRTCASLRRRCPACRRRSRR